MQTARYDIAIIGSGIAGSMLAAILARHGRRVVVFEAGSHPRFAIGESMILETSETLRAAAALYDVPELAYPTAEPFVPDLGTNHGVKRHFGFLYHSAAYGHDPHDPRQALQAVIPEEPHGHELHLYRADSDAFLAATAVRYGADLRQQTRVAGIALDADGVTVRTERGEVFEADYLVDAGGFRSVLAEQFGLRDGAPERETHSMALFTHLVNVPCYHEVAVPQQTYGLPFRMAEGTLHHVFPGGWLWVIPFDNHRRSTNPLCSVGLMRDPRVHPVDPDLSPEEDFRAFCTQFPSIGVQFAGAQAVRPWTRTGRIQFGSTRVVGDRWALLGHAAGFVDPLFSKGLYASLFAASHLAHHLLEATRTGDFSAEAFVPVARTTQAFLRENDRLVAHAYTAFADVRLWSMLSVLWLLGAHTELLKLFSIRAQATDRDGVIDRTAYFEAAAELQMVGGGYGPFATLADDLYADLDAVDLGDEQAVRLTAARMQVRLEAVGWMPYQFRQVLRGWKNHLGRRKLSTETFRQEGGPLGRGSYREHFFGEASAREVAAFLVREKAQYGWTARRLQRWQASR